MWWFPGICGVWKILKVLKEGVWGGLEGGVKGIEKLSEAVRVFDSFEGILRGFQGFLAFSGV